MNLGSANYLFDLFFFFGKIPLNSFLFLFLTGLNQWILHPTDLSFKMVDVGTNQIVGVLTNGSLVYLNVSVDDPDGQFQSWHVENYGLDTPTLRVSVSPNGKVSLSLCSPFAFIGGVDIFFGSDHFSTPGRESI